MSTEYQNRTNTMVKRDKYMAYQREYQKYRKSFKIKPMLMKKFKGYYDEYCTIQQQNQAPAVSFREFFFQFFELGFTNWRYRTKGI